MIRPTRTATNLRRYSDVQVKKLLNVATLVQAGYKISRVAQLGEKELLAAIAELETSAMGDTMHMAFTNDLIAAMAAFNEEAFEKAFSSAVLRIGLYECMVKVVYPMLNKTGILWQSSKLIPVQEHFASCIIRRKLMAATDGLAPASRKKPKYLLFLPEGEYHELALLFADYILRAGGNPTVYLGAAVPAGDLRLAVQETRPDILMTFFITGRSAADLNEGVKEIHRSAGPVPLLVSGSAAVLSLLKKHRNTEVIHDPASLVRKA